MTRIFLLATLLVIVLPARTVPHVWLSIPRTGLDHLPLRVPAAVFEQAEGEHRPVVLTVHVPWLYTLQTPQPHEKPPFPGDEIQIFVGPRSVYKPRWRYLVRRVTTGSRRDRQLLLRRYARPTLVLQRCWGRHCTTLIAQTAATPSRKKV